MIDWHSHILPGMDDGSRSVEESKALLQALAQQGVDTVVATPHFYADDEPIERFLQRRAEAYAKLAGICTVRILCGAEVRFYPGISKLEQLESLCLGGSFVLLLEMPEERWTEYTIREVLQLAGRFTLVLAHMERCIFLQKRGTLERLLENGVLMQTNASFYLHFATRRKALRLLKSGQVHMLGSDCHNMRSRPPRIGEAKEVICKKLGEEFLHRVNEFGEAVLNM